MVLMDCCPDAAAQGQADRVNYLMTRQAKVVAMTCTHAALKRRDFLDLAFKYDNLLLEEAAQILEIETFLPMLLQVGSSAVPPVSSMVSHCAAVRARCTGLHYDAGCRGRAPACKGLWESAMHCLLRLAVRRS